MSEDAICLPETTQLKYTKKQIHEVLLAIGMPPNLSGYRYTGYSMELIRENPDYLFHITKGLYIDVAKRYHSTPACVERSIRHAITTTWTNGDNEFRDYLFKNCIGASKSTPSNSLFLSRLYAYFSAQEFV